MHTLQGSASSRSLGKWQKFMTVVLPNVTFRPSLVAHHNWGEFGFSIAIGPKLKVTDYRPIAIFCDSHAPINSCCSCTSIFNATKFSLIVGPSASNSVFLATLSKEVRSRTTLNFVHAGRPSVIWLLSSHSYSNPVLSQINKIKIKLH